MWDLLIEVLNKYGLAITLGVALLFGASWLLYKAYKNALNFKMQEQEERFRQARSLEETFRTQQAVSNEAINKATEVMSQMLLKIDQLERDLHDNVNTDNSQNLSLHSLVNDLPKHAQECSVSNQRTLDELQKIHLEIIACKTLLQNYVTHSRREA